VFLFNNRFVFDKAIYLEKYFSAGIHPWDADLQVSIAEFQKIIQHPNCLAIGECGLDKLKGPDLILQKKVFTVQLELARKYQKPVIIHCVKAFDELIEICKPYHLQIPLIIHGFNKSLQMAKQMINKGFYLSLQSSVFDKLEDDFLSIPIEYIFLETDTNEKISIDQIYKTASSKFQISESDLKDKIYTNFTTLFNTNGR